MAYTAELCGCVEDERWEGLPKVSAASDYRNASDVCRPPLKKIGGGGGGTLFTGEFCPRGTLFTCELCLGDNIHLLIMSGGHFVGGQRTL